MKNVKRGSAHLTRALLGPLAGAAAANTIQRLMGFHFVWHLFGGVDALKKQGWGHTGIWRNRRDFRAVFGVEVEDAFPELAAAIVSLR